MSETKPTFDASRQELRTASFASKNTLAKSPSTKGAVAPEKTEIRVNMLDSPQKSTFGGMLLKIVDNTWFSLASTFVTIWALFGDDIRLAATEKDADPIFEFLTIVCLAFFTLELVATSIAKPVDYFLGFYFWLDFVATASMVFDIPQVMDAITESMGGEGDAAQSTTVLKAGRASRAGTKAGRIARLVRLIRILKLYKQYIARKEEMEKKGSVSNMEDEVENESRVGQRLSDLTTRRVIIGVLAMLFMLPLFDLKGGYYDEPLGLDYYGLEILHENAASGVGNTDIAIQTFLEGVKASKTATGGKLTHTVYHLTICNETYASLTTKAQAQAKRSDLRDDLEALEYAYESENNAGVLCVSEVFFDLKWESQLQAVLNIMRTIFICIILLMGAMSFSKDANELVLFPIERMIKKVRMLADNPLAGSKMQNEDDDEEDNQYETRILENAFVKISSLLAVGFGDAGAEIIGENMKSGGALNPMIPGKRIFAIFGFCDIRQFTDATEVLQEGIMEFVNSIAKIVHMEVALHGGSANKNIGDAFLLVWKFSKDVVASDLDDFDSVSEAKKKEIQELTDKALATFIVIMSGLKRSRRIKMYCDHPGLNERMPNYDVRMGFGLHAGWAIEGAIGSDYKIDASYLSPNVNMASRLEAATKQFRTPLLLSEDFCKLLSPSASSTIRQIDRVTVKGSNKPMGLFTFDVDLTAVVDPQDGFNLNSPVNNDSRTNETDVVTYSHHEFTDEFKENPDITKVHSATPEFLAKFGEAFKCYESGDWGKAKEIIDSIIDTRRDSNGETIRDGPSVTLLEVMEAYNFNAPSGWAGFRALTEK